MAPAEECRAAHRQNRPERFRVGLRHNDHVWIEFRDRETGEWTPADPTLNLVGFDQWLKARIAFGTRPTHPIVASPDMIVPFAIFAENGTTLEPRGERYLIAGFDSIYGGKLSTLPAWSEWTASVEAVQPFARGAFEGKVNLHDHAADVLAVKNASKNLHRSTQPRNSREASGSGRNEKRVPRSVAVGCSTSLRTNFPSSTRSGSGSAATRASGR